MFGDNSFFSFIDFFFGGWFFGVFFNSFCGMMVIFVCFFCGNGFFGDVVKVLVCFFGFGRFVWFCWFDGGS